MGEPVSFILSYEVPTTAPLFETKLDRFVVYLTGASTVAILVSIAAAQILLALALIALLFSKLAFRLPPRSLLLGLFLGGTLLSLAFSGDPASGTPQLRKFFVFLVLPLVFSAFRQARDRRALLLAWCAAGGLSAAWSLVQLVRKIQYTQAAGVDFYNYYVASRITGFMSHWMTFSGEMMVVLLVLLALLFFAPLARDKRWLRGGMALALLIGFALLISMTRSIWLATGAAVIYLVWRKRPLWLVALPVVFGAALLVPAVQDRARSLIQPRGDTDSNQHRIVTWRTGLEMIKTHPWLGLGPEQVGKQFQQYVPPSIPRPLPTGWYGHLHNIYLHYAAERGIPVMLCLVAWLLLMGFDFLQGLRGLPPGRLDRKTLLHAAVAVVIGTLVSGLFELNLGNSEILHQFLAIAGLAYAELEG